MTAETASLFPEPLEELRDDLDEAEVIDDGRGSTEPGKPRKRSKSKPVQRTLKYLRQQGCQLVAIVEKWNPYMNAGHGGRQDLFGIIDVFAIKDGQTIVVQCCSTDVSRHIDKMAEATFKNPELETECRVLPVLFAAKYKVYVHGWSRNAKGKWILREVELYENEN